MQPIYYPNLAPLDQRIVRFRRFFQITQVAKWRWVFSRASSGYRRSTFNYDAPGDADIPAQRGIGSQGKGSNFRKLGFEFKGAIGKGGLVVVAEQVRAVLHEDVEQGVREFADFRLGEDAAALFEEVP